MVKVASSAPSMIDAINAKFGANTIAPLGKVPTAQYKVISTGSIGLDHALGVGGLPRGRIVEIYGPESSGKTTLTLHILANAQKLGLLCAFIDAEHALDIKYASQLGVDVKNLLVSQPDYGEQALEIVDMLASVPTVGVVVIDSVAALVPKAELDGDIGDHHVGVQARMMSQALRKLVANCHRSETMVIFINQLRMKIGVKFGSPETTTGGNALKFYASVRLDARRIAGVKEGETQVANRTRVRVKKNKIAPPFTEAEFNIEFGVGIDKCTELVELGVATKVLEKAGTWIAFGDTKWQGRAKTAEFLESPEGSTVAEDIEAKVRQALVGCDAMSLTTSRESITDGKPARGKKKTQSTSAADAVAALKSAKLAPAEA